MRLPCPCKVLVVEDDSNIRGLLELLLTDAGYAVATAADGCAALDLAQRIRPDLITLDLHLPDVAGADVLRQLKMAAELHSIPVVVISACLDELAPADRRLAAALLAKPFDIDHTLSTVEQILNAGSRAARPR